MPFPKGDPEWPQLHRPNSRAGAFFSSFVGAHNLGARKVWQTRAFDSAAPKRLWRLVPADQDDEEDDVFK